MRSDSDDPMFDDVSDEELERIERELLEAAKGHKIPTDEAEPLDLEPIGEEQFTKLDELEARAEAMAHRASKMGRHDEDEEPIRSQEEIELDRRLESVEASARKARNTEHTRLSQDDEKRTSEGKAAAGLGVGVSIFSAMVGLFVLGLGIGYLIDNALGTNVWKGYCAVIGFGIGVGFAIFQLNRFQNKL